MIIAIDPGPVKSAALVWSGEIIIRADIVQNEVLLITLPLNHSAALVIESIESFGMAVGREVFETVFWSGRFAQAFKGIFYLLPRREVKMHLCQSMRAKDSNIRQALIDRFGPVPTKKESPRAYGGFKISKDLWSAWAIAVTWWDKNK